MISKGKDEVTRCISLPFVIVWTSPVHLGHALCIFDKLGHALGLGRKSRVWLKKPKLYML